MSRKTQLRPARYTKRSKPSLHKRLLTAVLVLAAFCVLLYSALHSRPGASKYRIEGERAPAGLRIVQISDLHCDRFGEGQRLIIDLVARQNADIIVMTGDMFDQKKTDTAAVRELLSGLTALGVPVYSVSGNHEKWHPHPQIINDVYERYGVIQLENRFVDLDINGRSVRLCGISDPDMWFETLEDPSILEEGFTGAPPAENRYNILLFHRANLFPHLAGRGYDLVLAGHIHGGQVRLPFFGGVASPYRSWWPEYDAGLYELEGTTMVVSRGLGNSIKFPRVFNPPEICVIEFVE